MIPDASWCMCKQHVCEHIYLSSSQIPPLIATLLRCFCRARRRSTQTQARSHEQTHAFALTGQAHTYTHVKCTPPSHAHDPAQQAACAAIATLFAWGVHLGGQRQHPDRALHPRPSAPRSFWILDCLGPGNWLSCCHHFVLSLRRLRHERQGGLPFGRACTHAQVLAQRWPLSKMHHPAPHPGAQELKTTGLKVTPD